MKQQMNVLQYELPITITPLEEGGYLARCEKLQGCMAEGETVEKALAYITDVARQIIDIRKEEGMSIPLRVIKKTNAKLKIRFSVPLIYQFNV